jgi:cell division transport system permease protein
MARDLTEASAAQPVTRADRVVPPSGFTASLTLFTAAAMAFLAVIALALALAAGRLADEWDAALSDTATIRIAAPEGQEQAQADAVLAILASTPGVASYRALTDAETAKLLEPWLGPDLPLDALPVPRLVEVVSAPGGYDADGLRQRLSGEAPGAVLDDHTRWRAPMVAAALRLRLLSWTALCLIGLATAATVTLAARAALAANGQVIRVLRLVGARDAFIARAFVRRFTRRAFAGAMLGTALGALALLLVPRADEGAALIPDLALSGTDWIWAAAFPVVAALTAFAATRAAAFRTLREVT